MIIKQEYTQQEISDFKDKVDYNTDVLKTAIKTGDPIYTMAGKIYTWDYKPGEIHNNVLMRNMFDLIPSMYLGVLANMSANGVDAFTITDDGSLESWEIKTAEINSKNASRGPQGGLYTNHSQETALRSGVNAAYTLHSRENLLSKNMKTALLFCDTNYSAEEYPEHYIDAWQMSGDDVVNYLRRTSVKKRHIKLGSFMKMGTPITTKIQLMGVYNWENKIKARLTSR